MLRVAGGLVPRPLPALGTVEGVDARAVGASIAVRVARHRHGGIPEIGIRCSEREVTHVVGGEPPRQAAIGAAARRRPAHATVALAHHAHDLPAARCGVEPRAHQRRQHLLGIPERARRADQPPGRNGQRHVVVAVAHVELRVPHIGVGVPPAVDVVVHGDVRVPVRHEVHFAVRAAARRAVRRDGQGPLHFHRHGIARHERMIEREPQHRRFHLVPGPSPIFRERGEGAPVHSHLPQLHAPGDGHDPVPHGAGCEQVVVEMQIDRCERIRRPVDVHDGAPSLEAGGRGIERRREAVARELPPVARPWTSGPRARARVHGRGKRRRLEHRIRARTERRRLRSRAGRRRCTAARAGREHGERGGNRQAAEQPHGWDHRSHG